MEHSPREPQTESVPHEETAFSIPPDQSEVYTKFKDNFNVSAELLSTINGFDELSTDKKAFVLHQLQQTTLTQIETDDINQFRTAQAEARLLKKIWLGVTKGWQLADTRRNIARDAAASHSNHAETIAALTELVGSSPAIRQGFTEGGKPTFVFDFASTADFGEAVTEREQQVIESFNEAARNFNDIPYQYKQGTPEQQEIYELAESLYRASQNSLLTIKEQRMKAQMPQFENEAEQAKNEATIAAETLAYGNSLDQALILNQFLSSNPDVEQVLTNIKDESRTMQLIKRFKELKGTDASNPAFALTMAAGGFGIRSVAIGAIGLAAAPLVGAGIGSLRARATAKEMLAENERLARAGQTWNSSETPRLQQKNVELFQSMQELADQAETLRKEREQLVQADSETGLNTNRDRIEEIDRQLAGTRNRYKALLAKVELSEARNINVASNAGNKYEYDESLTRSKNLELGYKVNLSDKLEELINRIDSEENDDKKTDLLTKLQHRIDFTEDRVRSGLVDYGKAENQRSSQLQLLQQLEKARKYVQTYAPSPEQIKINNLFEERLNHYLNYREEAIDERQRKFVTRKMWKGALLGGSFAAVGSALRDISGNLLPSAEAAEAASEELPPSTAKEAAAVTSLFASDINKVFEGNSPADIGAAVGAPEGAFSEIETTPTVEMHEVDITPTPAAEAPSPQTLYPEPPPEAPALDTLPDWQQTNFSIAYETHGGPESTMAVTQKSLDSAITLIKKVNVPDAETEFLQFNWPWISQLDTPTLFNHNTEASSIYTTPTEFEPTKQALALAIEEEARTSEVVAKTLTAAQAEQWSVDKLVTEIDSQTSAGEKTDVIPVSELDIEQETRSIDEMIDAIGQDKPDPLEVSTPAEASTAAESPEPKLATEPESNPHPLTPEKVAGIELSASIPENPAAMHTANLLNELKATPDYTINNGDTLTKIISKKLAAHTESFGKLDEVSQNTITALLKERLYALSPSEIKDFGVRSGNINLIHPGEKLDFTVILNDETVAQIQEIAATVPDYDIYETVLKGDTLSDYINDYVTHSPELADLKGQYGHDTILNALVQNAINADKVTLTEMGISSGNANLIRPGETIHINYDPEEIRTTVEEYVKNHGGSITTEANGEPSPENPTPPTAQPRSISEQTPLSSTKIKIALESLTDTTASAGHAANLIRDAVISLPEEVKSEYSEIITKISEHTEKATGEIEKLSAMSASANSDIASLTKIEGQSKIAIHASIQVFTEYVTLNEELHMSPDQTIQTAIDNTLEKARFSNQALEAVRGMSGDDTAGIDTSKQEATTPAESATTNRTTEPKAFRPDIAYGKLDQMTKNVGIRLNENSIGAMFKHEIGLSNDWQKIGSETVTAVQEKNEFPSLGDTSLSLGINNEEAVSKTKEHIRLLEALSSHKPDTENNQTVRDYFEHATAFAVDRAQKEFGIDVKPDDSVDSLARKMLATAKSSGVIQRENELFADYLTRAAAVIRRRA